MIRKTLAMFFLSLVLFMNGCNAAHPLTSTTLPNAPFSTSSSEKIIRSGTGSFKIYLIALEDGGKSGLPVGCGDSLIAVEIPAADRSSALQFLLANRDTYYGQSGLYDALAKSILSISRFEEHETSMTVELTGKLILSGVCDNPRVKEQLLATIRQSAKSDIPVTIRINGILLDDLLSEK